MRLYSVFDSAIFRGSCRDKRSWYVEEEDRNRKRTDDGRISEEEGTKEGEK